MLQTFIHTGPYLGYLLNNKKMYNKFGRVETIWLSVRHWFLWWGYYQSFINEIFKVKTIILANIYKNINLLFYNGKFPFYKILYFPCAS
jgi:hypothetical protein